jgi:hypothetical protein
MELLAEIVEYLGIHKSPLFVFVLLGARLIHDWGKELRAEPSVLWVKYSGVVLYYIPVLMIIAALVFYFWASRKLPGSTQELEFERSSEQTLKKHHAGGRRRSR